MLRPSFRQVQNTSMYLLFMGKAQEMYAPLHRDKCRLGRVSEQLDLFLSIRKTENNIIRPLSPTH